MIVVGHPQTGDREQPTTWPFALSFYNNTLIPMFKMMGRCSIHTWDFWENNTGNEVGRPVHGVQETGTIVARWYIPEGGT